MTDVFTPTASRTRGDHAPHLLGRPRRNRLRIAVIGLVALALLTGEGVLGVSVWRAHKTRDRRQQALTKIQRQLRAVDSRLGARKAQLDALRRDLTIRTTERDDAVHALARVRQDLSYVNVGVANAKTQATVNGAQIDALSTCLSGAQQAVLRIDTGDINGAVASLRWVQSACDRALTAAGGDGPVFPFDFADPFVLRVGSTYYAYSTNAGAGNVQVIRSNDLRHWELLGNALPNLPPWAAPNATWAPAVLARTGFYVLYYAAPDNAAGQRCIAAAVALAPEGPYVDSSPNPIMCRIDLGGAIDPSPFVDARGNAWLLWRTEGRDAQPGAIWSAPLAADGRSLAGDPTPLIHADQRWEQGVVEAPAMVPMAGGFALFYSGNDWNSRHYGVGFARCTSPAGPCTKPVGHPVLASHDAVAGPGGAEFFTDPGGAQWMAYHAFAERNVGYPASRLLRLARVSFVNGLPVFAPPPW